MFKFIACFELRQIAYCISLKFALVGQLGHFKESLNSFHHSPRATNLVINRRTGIEYYANKFSTLIPIKPLGLIGHGLCFLGVNVFSIECITSSIECFHLRDYRPYWFAETKESICIPRGLVWDTNMAAISLFWDTNMVAVTSCENTL